LDPQDSRRSSVTPPALPVVPSFEQGPLPYPRRVTNPYPDSSQRHTQTFSTQGEHAAELVRWCRFACTRGEGWPRLNSRWPSGRSSATSGRRPMRGMPIERSNGSEPSVKGPATVAGADTRPQPGVRRQLQRQ